MLSPLALEEELSQRHRDAASIVQIRATYRRSGLYRNDGSINPLWIYQGGWRPHPVIIAPDGVHMIFPGNWTKHSGFEVVEFTRRGQTIRRFEDADLIPFFYLKCLLNGCTQVTCGNTSFNPHAMTYIIRTNQGEEFTLDVRTGQVIAVSSPVGILCAFALAAALAAIIGLVLWLRRRIALARQPSKSDRDV
jgi:hypothetical protein